MKTTLPYLLKPYALSLGITCISFLCQAQNFKGKDGAANFSTPGTYILNRYTTLAGPENAGALSITVANVGSLNATTTFTNSINAFATAPLSKGDLIMIIQVQGADITTSDDASYGDITSYNNTGNYELRTVFDVSGNTILLCQNLVHSYLQGGRSRTEVIRIPRFTSLTIGTGVTLTGLAWDGTSGGVVALEAATTIEINGTVSADHIGFRGGVDDKNFSSASGIPAVTLYRTTDNTAATKGESIAGNATDYSTYLAGANGRGAPANGGGGGNGHNTGGGGGSNAASNGALSPWNGTGIKDISTPSWADAWNLESASFATDISTGGGRGGYSYGNSNQDALTLAPGSNAWGGDRRNNVGGFGGRPLDYNSDTRLFMGGGGGAGEGNNNSAGNGGNGGGIVFIKAETISGTGTITANGQNGFDTQNSNIDAAGGAGGGGAIGAVAATTITGISMTANGGVGGNQLYLTGEAEGPGGGGGGGYIATTTTSVSRNVQGGHNGMSQSLLITEFLPNGATQGAVGTIGSKNFVEIAACDPFGYILPVRFISFNASLQESAVTLKWITSGETKGSRYEIERSIDGIVFTRISAITVMEPGKEKSEYAFSDNRLGTNTLIYYRIKWINTDNKPSYSEIRIIHLNKQSNALTLNIYPNPVANDLRITFPNEWQGKQVKLEIYDVTGKLTRSLVKQQASQTETIAMNDLVKGFYLVKASMGKEIAQQKLIKN